MRARTITVAYILLIAIVAALVVDRVTLYLWQVQVIRYYQSLQRSAAAGEAKPPASPYGYVSIGLEPLLVMPKHAQAPVRYLTLQTDVLLAKPNTITVDGDGGLHLRFLPPPLAWTTRAIPRSDPGEHADPVSVDWRLAYQYKIDIEPIGATDVAVTLTRGPGHFAQPLSPGEQRPLLFP